MDFTVTQQEIITNAYLLALEGKGQVIEDWAIPDAHELAEQGWLERRFVSGDGEMSWWWTDKADTALALSNLTTNQSPN